MQAERDPAKCSITFSLREWQPWIEAVGSQAVSRTSEAGGSSLVQEL